MIKSIKDNRFIPPPSTHTRHIHVIHLYNSYTEIANEGLVLIMMIH